jgi:hypothetical protein
MTVYKLNEEKMFCDINDNVAIVINSETGIYYGMNGFGTAVFEKIIENVSEEGVLRAIEALPGAPANMEKRLGDFIKKLLKSEILLKSSSKGVAKASVDEKIASADDFVLEFSEYSDAQELLLADPIHDIKDEIGWKPDKSAKETDEKKLKRKKEKEKKLVEATTKTTTAKTEKKTTARKPATTKKTKK